MNRPSTHLVPLIYTALACAGLLTAIIGGTNTTLLAIGLSIALVAGMTAAIAWRRSGPIGDRISTDGWWKLVLAGPCIIGSVIIGAGLGIEAWTLGVFAILVAFVVSAIGVMLGITRVATRRSRAIPT